MRSAFFHATVFAAISSLSVTAHAQSGHWIRSWATGAQVAARPGTPRALPDLADRTIRQIVQISAGGDQIRLHLTNELTPHPLRIDSVHVSRVDLDGRIIAGSDREVRFAGKIDATMAANAPLTSDPVSIAVPALATLAIDIHVPESAPDATFHLLAGDPVLLAVGNRAGQPDWNEAQPLTSRALLAGVDVSNTAPRSTIVAFGDSITDGAYATPGRARRWPDLLARKLQAAGMDMAVANTGIGGNRILRPGSAASGLARFDRDVLAVPGVRHVIILEGINDIGSRNRDSVETGPPVTAERIIDGLRQMIARAHAHDLSVVLGTLLPFGGGNRSWDAQGEDIRNAVNQWVRTSEEADGFIDFDKVMADAKDSTRMRAEFDSGDHVHPNDAGFAAMADAIDLKLFAKKPLRNQRTLY